MTPRADVQQLCVAWLEEYFDTYGDNAPNRDETLLNITFRREVYKSYKAAQEKCKQPFVQESRW